MSQEFMDCPNGSEKHQFRALIGSLGQLWDNLGTDASDMKKPALWGAGSGIGLRAIGSERALFALLAVQFGEYALCEEVRIEDAVFQSTFTED